MPHQRVGSTLGGAASGATLGSFFGPPGTIAGGIIGGAAGLFGGSGDGHDEEEVETRGDRLRQLFEERVERLRGISPTETATFRSGTSALRDALREQARRDESSLAARGLTGSQADVALDESRARTLGRQTRQLLGESERRLESDRQSALRGLLSAIDLESGIAAERRRLEARRKGRLADLVGSGLQAGATIFASRGGGGGG